MSKLEPVIKNYPGVLVSFICQIEFKLRCFQGKYVNVLYFWSSILLNKGDIINLLDIIYLFYFIIN